MNIRALYSHSECHSFITTVITFFKWLTDYNALEAKQFLVCIHYALVYLFPAKHFNSDSKRQLNLLLIPNTRIKSQREMRINCNPRFWLQWCIQTFSLNVSYLCKYHFQIRTWQKCNKWMHWKSFLQQGKQSIFH